LILIHASMAVAEGSGRMIVVIQHPAFLETLGNTERIKPNTYEFLIVNNANRDAEFILVRKGTEPMALMVKQDDIGRLKVELERGDYTYYSPEISTRSYPLTVRGDPAEAMPDNAKRDTMVEPPRIGPHDAHTAVEAGKALLVCAYRNPDTCRRMHLEGAIFLEDFEQKLPSLPEDQEIIFYCA